MLKKKKPNNRHCFNKGRSLSVFLLFFCQYDTHKLLSLFKFNKKKNNRIFVSAFGI